MSDKPKWRARSEFAKEGGDGNDKGSGLRDECRRKEGGNGCLWRQNLLFLLGEVQGNV